MGAIIEAVTIGLGTAGSGLVLFSTEVDSTGYMVGAALILATSALLVFVLKRGPVNAS